LLKALDSDQIPADWTPLRKTGTLLLNGFWLEDDAPAEILP
jgi:hypothetical protein